MNQAVLGALLLVSSVAGFAWDAANIERLFKNSDEIFQKLYSEVEPREVFCVQNFANFVFALKNDESHQALRTIDSWSKEPAGLYSDVSTDFGHFDQCSGSNQYCQLLMENAKNSSYKFGICLSDTCEEDTILKVLKPFFRNVDVDVQSVLQCNTGEQKFGALQWTVLVLCILIGLIMLWATVYELRGGSGLLATISVHRNANKLFEIKPEFTGLSCLNGIRVLTMVQIVFLHSYQAFFFFYDLYNPQDMDRFQKTLFRAVIENGDVAVDTFFLLGGLLLTYNFMKARKKNEKFNYFKFLLHRYLRVMPVFIFVALLLVAFGPFQAHGPRMKEWTEGFEIENCRKNWWMALLQVQNYVHPFEMCIAPTWYISADFQLYVISPLLLFPLFKFGKKFLPFLAAIALGSFVFVFTFSYMNEFHFNNRPALYWSDLYYPTHSRFGQWLIGVVLGYFLVQTEGREVRINKGLQVTFWTLSVAAVVGVFVIPWFSYEQETETVLAFAFYASLSRQIWCLVIGWIIFACVKGYGGLLNWVLTFPIYQPLAKISYALFLWHNPVLFHIQTVQYSLVYFSNYFMMHFYLGIYLISLFLAVPVILAVEMPVASLETGVFKKIENRSKENKA